MHAAALDRRRRAIRTVGINVALGESIIGGVRENQHSGRAASLGIANLQPAEQTAVARQHDLPLDLDPHFLELLEVLGPAEVGVDDLAGGLARYAIAMKGTERRAAGGIFVGGDRGFIERERLGDRAIDREARGLRPDS